MDAVKEAVSAHARSRPDAQWPKALSLIFVPQMALSLAYAGFLWLANIYDKAAVHSYLEVVSRATRWLAGLLPISGYADAVANPAISLSAELIRHLFPLLVALNLIPGVAGFLFTKPLSEYYSRLLEANPKAFNSGFKIYLFLVAVPIYFLFLDPVIALGPMSLLDYFMGSISPALLFYAAVQADAMNRARGAISI